MNDSPFAATGALLDFKDEKVTVDRFTSLPGVVATRLAARGWSHLVLSSRQPLLGEAGVEAEVFRYRFLFRTGKNNRALVLGMKQSLVLLLLSRLGVIDNTHAPSVMINALVEDFILQPGSRYLLGAIVARVEGYGNRLRTLILYGDDLGSTTLVKSLADTLSPYRATLRRFAGRQEVISIGSHGEVNFQYTDTQSLREADRSLAFLSSKGFIDWQQTYRAEVSLKH